MKTVSLFIVQATFKLELNAAKINKQELFCLEKDGGFQKISSQFYYADRRAWEIDDGIDFICNDVCSGRCI